MAGTCVVDGRFSTRSSWNKQYTTGGTTYLACDFHSDAAIISAAQMCNTGTANSISPSSPVPTSKNPSKNIHEAAG